MVTEEGEMGGLGGLGGLNTFPNPARHNSAMLLRSPPGRRTGQVDGVFRKINVVLYTHVGCRGRRIHVFHGLSLSGVSKSALCSPENFVKGV